ncbi:FMN-binding negative transcriptional regulator [uncultured Agrococcus sp.]|uniref:FMN-binding negative transcriptional regulator n=1 Tax=uncultured Agrococcus sp. TaxID=382258 RepID=UPI0025EAFB7A|nr:FMN-binding negative transcriptional regulator [uncultured Agrococcus sp.]
MRRTPHFTVRDPEAVKRLIREHPWATIVSNTKHGLVASHYPIMVEEDREDFSIVSHVGKPDDRDLELGEHEVMIIVQGPHGYVSPGWYEVDQAVPTWNHVTAHLYGTPEILTDAENWEALSNLVGHFENASPHPQLLEDNAEYGRKIFSGTAGFRMVVDRFEARAKLSQNKPDDIVDRVIDQLDGDGPWRQPRLADEMRREHER